MAVDLMQIHRRSNKNKRTAFLKWIEEMKKHVDYIISTCPLKVFSSSNNSTFVNAMKETTIKVIDDMFSVAQSHEDHLIQNHLFEEMENQDDGKGKRLTWSAMLKPRRPLSKSKAASRSEGSGDKIEVDDSHTKIVQPTPQSLLQTSTIPKAASISKEETEVYDLTPVSHLLQLSFQTTTSSLDLSLNSASKAPNSEDYFND
jgi:hypothetical protein